MVNRELQNDLAQTLIEVALIPGAVKIFQWREVNEWFIHKWFSNKQNY